MQNNCPYNQVKSANNSANPPTNFLCDLCPANEFYNTANTSCVNDVDCVAGTFARTTDQFCA